MTIPHRPTSSAALAAPVEAASMLVLATDAFGGYGGIAQYNRDFLHAVARSGLFGAIQVLPRLAPFAAGPLPAGLEQTRPIKGRILFTLRALVRALRTRPTVIFNAHVLHGPLALVLARLTRARLVSQLHGTEAWKPFSFFARMALEASDLVLAVSRDTRARALDQLRIAPERVVVLNNTFGDAFCPGDRETVRRRLGLGDEIAILTVSRLDGREGYKGHDRIIRLLPELAAQGLTITYLVAGTGPDEERLAQLAQDLNVSDQVRFLGLVAADELPGLYRAADLFALPSTGEGFGIAFVEAMACGTPAIGLSVGGASDALADGVLGTCVSPAAFPNALRAALHIGDKASEDLPYLVRERFGQEKFDHALAMHLRELAARGLGPQPSELN